MTKELAATLLILTAVPLCVLLGIVMNGANCSEAAIAFATTFQFFIQLMLGAMLMI